MLAHAIRRKTQRGCNILMRNLGKVGHDVVRLVAGGKAGRDGSFSWEKTDLVGALKAAVK